MAEKIPKKLKRSVRYVALETIKVGRTPIFYLMK